MSLVCVCSPAIILTYPTLWVRNKERSRKKYAHKYLLCHVNILYNDEYRIVPKGFTMTQKDNLNFLQPQVQLCEVVIY